MRTSPRDWAFPSRDSVVRISKGSIVEQGIVASISGITIWRWLSRDAIKPWQYRSWLFPRDPKFASKAGPILDLYQKKWMGIPLGPTDYVISTDEKTSIQARKRKAETLPPQPGSPMRVEHEYEEKRRSGLSCGLGCSSSKDLWSMRKKDWHQTLRKTGGPNHEPRAV